MNDYITKQYLDQRFNDFEVKINEKLDQFKDEINEKLDQFKDEYIKFIRNAAEEFSDRIVQSLLERSMEFEDNIMIKPGARHLFFIGIQNKVAEVERRVKVLEDK